MRLFGSIFLRFMLIKSTDYDPAACFSRDIDQTLICRHTHMAGAASAFDIGLSNMSLDYINITLCVLQWICPH